MSVASVFDHSSSDRELLRQLRRGATQAQRSDVMPESVAWHLYIELRRRGNERATSLFMDTLRHLHKRRSLGSVDLCAADIFPDEHRLVEVQDPFLADLWKAYKRCIQHNRTGPASQLLRDIDEQLSK